MLGGVLRGGSLVVAATSVLAAWCAAPPSTPAPTPGSPVGSTARTCMPAAVRSCALPYPSDQLTVEDRSTPTGRRVSLPRDLIPAAAQDALGPGAKLDDVQADADGFSAVGPVIFELDRPVDPASLPVDGGDVVRAFDVADGDPVDLRVELSFDSVLRGGAGTIVMAWPMTRWEPGHTYVARLADGLTSPTGPPARPDGMDGPAGSFIASVSEDLSRIEGDRWPTTVAATRFTVRSTSSATGDLEAMVATARRADHPVRNFSVVPPVLVGSGAAMVFGEVRLTDFRDADGVARPGPATDAWAPFMMTLPAQSAGPAGAPVVVYGHGLMASKETLLVVAGTNAARGMATIGIDMPNHGARQEGQGGFLLDILNPASFGRLASMPIQGEVDTVSLVQAITTHMSDLDLAGSGPAGWMAPDGVADLDTSRLFYEGTSMGGVLGASSVAHLDELQGAYLQVPGSGIADILYHSVLWPLFSGLIPQGLGAGDAAALQGLGTLLLDRSDNTYLLDHLRDAERPVFLQYGLGDWVVPNVNTERLAALVDLPLVGPEIAPIQLEVRRTGTVGIPSDGRGVAQVDPVSTPKEVAFFLAHLSFLTEQVAYDLLDQWLVNRMEATGLATS